MTGQKIRLLITDFDGTLVDTFTANYKAYSKAFADNGLSLSEMDYHQCFGLRFEKFMEATNVVDDKVKQSIKKLKGKYYPSFFDEFKVNHTLLSLIRSFHEGGGKTSVASTARLVNLENVLTHIGALHDFDLILAGEEVVHGKPSPEIYLSALRHFDISPSEALVFEDSEIGVKAAQTAGLNYIVIDKNYYGNRS